jgi:hypothetical protein
MEAAMKRMPLWLTLSILVSLPVASSCFGFETLMIEEPHRTIVIQGHFGDRPWGAFPSEVLFSYEEQSQQSSNHEKYYFSGSKEEDSFEIRHTWAKFGSFRAGRPEEEILKVPFKTDEEYSLPMTILTFKNCTKKDLAVLKMISLEKNRLSYRIILPDCLREAIKKQPQP